MKLFDGSQNKLPLNHQRSGFDGLKCVVLLMMTIFSLIYVISANNSSTDQVRSKLDIELKATWKETSLLMEAFEYFSDKLPNHKTSFLKAIPCEKVDQIKNDRNTILNLAQQSKATGAEVSLLDFALDTRHYSPRVKVQYTKNINTPKSSLNTIVSKNVEDIEFLDHTFNINSDSKQINFIYSDITSQEGCKFVRENIDSTKPTVLRLVRLDSTGSIDKEDMIKEKYMEEASSDLLSIRGYGVELQIKNMEYKQTADDDIVSGNDTFFRGVNFNKLKKNYPHLSNDLDTLKLHIQQSDSKSEKLKVWEMKYFGLQAMKKISDQPNFDEKIKMLQDISQNFPSYMKELKNTAFENSFKEEIESHLSRYDGEFKSRNPNNPQEVIRRNALYLNGLELDLTKLSIFSLFETMDKELKLVKSLASDYHLSPSSVNSVLFSPSTASKDLRFKFSSELEKQIIWFNNIESDSYNNFPRELKSMLYPTMYGQMRFVKRNLFNVVFILDPASTQKQVAHLLFILGNIMNRGYPVRIGALFVPKVSSGFVDVDLTGSSSATPETVDELSLHAVSLLERMGKENRAIFPILREFMDRESFDVNFVDDLQRRFFGSVKLMSQQELISRHRSFTSMGFNVKSSSIIMVNGAVVQGDEQDSSDQLVMKGVREQYDAIKNLIENNVIVDSDKNLLEKIINHYGGFDKFNSEIFSKKQYSIVSLGEIDQINFVQHPESGGAVKKTHILCVGGNQDASSLVKEAISFISENKNTRIGFLNVDNSAFTSIAKYHALYKPNGSNQLSGKSFCAKHFNAKESGIISMNGRVIPLSKLFTSKDFTILDAFEDVNSAIISTVESNSYSTVDPDVVTSDYLSDILFGVSSVLKVYNQHKRQDLNHVRSNSIATLETESIPSAEIKLIAVLNPLSKFAQKFTPMIRFVKEKLGKSVNVVVHLNPDLETSNLPLQSYYSYVLSGSSVAEFNTRFADVKGRIFTMWMDVPESWLVDSTNAKEDLDNLKLDECASQKCYARFQLEYFVTSGTCIDENGRPVRGLQLQLVHNYGTNASNVDDTTLVMANYGYFQLRASSPNIYSVNLPKGRHSEIYSVQSTKQVDFYSQSELQHSDGYGNADTKKFLVSVHSFDAPFARVVVKRNSGMEKEDLLAPSQTSSGWSSWLSGSNNQEKKTIHIFSLASGLMYERLLKIMILSVRKHLKRSDVKVKFWFLKQFLSPSFKQFLPEYAKAYNFEYGLISYQWPHWLHKQQTKQRLIWAYKVLFLDVLFPLQEVNKIIFVDADQVCRTDMSELFFDLDMQGKALAYTPFCDSRKEMDGYRFWKSGYWSNHLGGRPYHISALYVVDIDMFRRNYHGDQFRMVYDNLARDPNSLSNLDQDLPNYAQHNVPIRSLPQEWLWCESWCSDESKAKAKTIDLCNNPQTKEHKLASAKRIIPEWTDYDNEIKDFQKKLVVGK